MGRPKGFSADHVVESALEAFWRKGYAATSAQDLVDSTGLGRGSLYNAFSSKRGLFLEALRRYDGEWTARQAAVLEGDGDVRDRVREVLMNVVDAETAGEAGRRGCLAVNSAIELAGLDDEVTRIVRGIFRRMETAFREALERARRDGGIEADRDPGELALYLLNSMYGLRVLGKTTDRAALEGVVETVIRAL
ncbi:TetR/AcrR family transcriptional regulator [Bailinhaonella thermotolerans]|uniref:TetR/AcrR family transcriptional regulator n=1 Tax=Bailinhaonella thermotolerans TaxID=1070861 RepID=A0A3A4AUC5_9ACTN|nr:TetR/AcrR family transcriptional regulator [Bailinhaonella thermotolerans]RJL33165.1 TetR/AcrR family transcriptional regulator [Bailinhaonella thermotolerans]